MEVQAATHIGRVRENNEDSFWVGKSCLVVCDGMGGHQAGEVASRLAVETISTYPFSGEDPPKEVRAAIEKAHGRVKARASEDPHFYGMGTTLTLACVTPLGNGTLLTVGHVGDSRAYLFSDRKLVQLTSDHSVVEELVRQGTLTPQEAKHHAQRHVLTQALGSGAIEIELITKKLVGNCFLLLCTDGLTDVVEDEQIGRVLAEEDSWTDAAQKLIDLANSLGGPDNITVLVAQVT